MALTSKAKPEPFWIERIAAGHAPRLRTPGESAEDYRVAMGWDQPPPPPTRIVPLDVLVRAREHVPYLGETWKALTQAIDGVLGTPEAKRHKITGEPVIPGNCGFPGCIACGVSGVDGQTFSRAGTDGGQDG
jgi:hypothetical protein